MFVQPDGRAWHLEKRAFTHESGKRYAQFIATDVTKLHEKRVELQEEDSAAYILTCAVLKKAFKHIKVIIVTSMAEYTFLEKAKEARADSFWYKDTSHGELLPVMDRTMAGEHIFPDKTPQVRLGLSSSYDLTRAELEVLRALMQSTGVEDAARMIGCTKANIRWHISKILEKTGYRTRMELLIAVAQKNLIIVTPDKAFED